MKIEGITSYEEKGFVILQLNLLGIAFSAAIPPKRARQLAWALTEAANKLRRIAEKAGE